MKPTRSPIEGREQIEARTRLDHALDEQDRLTDRYQAAIGTTSEMTTYARLREAGEQVAARGAWLRWTEREY